MTLLSHPTRNFCRSNVIIRRANLLVCCDLFEGEADEAGVWQRFTCRDHVRAQRGTETVWAERATFLADKNDLVLTGHPLLRRGDTLLEGERVVIDLTEEHARISRPRGRIQAQIDKFLPAPLSIDGPLPNVCPIAPLKR